MTSWVNRLLLVLSFVWMISSPSWARVKRGVPAGDPQKQAEEAWAKRDQAYETESAIVLWQQAVSSYPAHTEIWISLTKAAGRAFRNAKTDKEREYWAGEGREFGAKAVELNPKNSMAYAEYGAALGQWAKSHKGMGSLKIVKLAVKNLEIALELDARNAHAHMILARFYENAPAMFSVGDKKKALEQAKLAVEYGPDYAINHLTLANLYIARDLHEDAKKELEATLKLKAPADAIPETKSDQDAAKELLAELVSHAKS